MEDFLKNISDSDQTLAAMRTLAQMLSAYRKELKEQGFADEEVWLLLLQFQGNLFGRKDS